MANRLWYQKVQSLLCGRTDISGSFCPNGAGAVPTRSDVVTANRPTGAGYTVARTGVGVFTLTFADQYFKLISATATMQLAASADTVVQVGTYDPLAKTLALTVLTAGAPSDSVTLLANNRVHFQCTFSVSSVD